MFFKAKGMRKFACQHRTSASKEFMDPGKYNRSYVVLEWAKYATNAFTQPQE